MKNDALTIKCRNAIFGAIVMLLMTAITGCAGYDGMSKEEICAKGVKAVNDLSLDKWNYILSTEEATLQSGADWKCADIEGIDGIIFRYNGISYLCPGGSLESILNGEIAVSQYPVYNDFDFDEYDEMTGSAISRIKEALKDASASDFRFNEDSSYSDYMYYDFPTGGALSLFNTQYERAALCFSYDDKSVESVTLLLYKNDPDAVSGRRCDRLEMLNSDLPFTKTPIS